MKRFLAILILLTVLGCGKPAPEQHLKFWQEMYMQAAKDKNTAQTLEAHREAGNRMERYEWEMNKAHDAMITGNKN